MSFDSLMRDIVTLVRKDGSKHETLYALVTLDRIYTLDLTTPIEVGDSIERQLPSGRTERLLVTLVHEWTGDGPVPSSREISYERADTRKDAVQEENDHLVMRVFISHSSRDVHLAEAVVNLLRNALNLQAGDIRCTSVDGYGLPGGVSTDDQLRLEVHVAELVVGLITPSSLRSAYVAFELGARWGANRPMIPLLGKGASPNDLEGPLRATNALDCSREPQVYQFIEDASEVLKCYRGRTSSFIQAVNAVVVAASEPLADPQTGPMESPNLSTLSAISQELLIKASTDSGGGYITFTHPEGGIKVGTKSERLFDKDPPREAALWVQAISELEDEGLIKDRTGAAEVYWLTSRGSEVADQLKFQT